MLLFLIDACALTGISLKKYLTQGDLNMLVLKRVTDESIMIGDDIEIIFYQIKNNSARIGIRAPKNIPIHRKEIYEKINKS